MKISTKFLTASSVFVGLITTILIANTVIVQQMKQTIRKKSNQTTQTVQAALEAENALKDEISALKDVVLLKSENTEISKSQTHFLESLNKLEGLMPEATEISVIRRRHQFLTHMATQLTQRKSSETPLAEYQQSFRAINSFNRDIEFFLHELIERAYQQNLLAEQELESLYQMQRILSFAVVKLIIILLIGKFVLMWRPVIQSLQKLQLGTTEIAAGNLDYRLNIRTGDEVEDLADKFNHMAVKLAQSRETLLKNTELTKMNQRLEVEISERKQAEAELQQALKELQSTQAQLIQTEKMSSLGQLVAGVAHEINNPVSFIYGNVTHLKEYTQDLLELIHLYQQEFPNPGLRIQKKVVDMDLEFVLEDFPKILSSMKIGTERIRDIVLSLRNFSRLDQAEMKKVDIHEGINSTLLILQNRLKAKPNHPNIEIIKEYGDLPQVECYAGQLNQVFMNIINNAIDALEESFVNSHLSLVHSKGQMNGSCYNAGDPRNALPPNDKGQIRIYTELASNNRVVIRIADNGPGMTEEVKKKLFDPFFTTKPVGKGTGLGLAISYQIIVEKHAGILRLESQLGKGTEFWIEIPLRQENIQTLSTTESVKVMKATA